MGLGTSANSASNNFHLHLKNETRMLFDTLGETEMIKTFLDELRNYRVLINESFGSHPQQQKQICFLTEGLLGDAIYFDVPSLLEVAAEIIEASTKEVATSAMLEKMNQEVDAILKGN